MDKINTMSYSPQLVYFLDRMSGFSTNIFKLMPSGSDSSGPNSISRITLPSNALLNTRSFKLHFLASTVVGRHVLVDHLIDYQDDDLPSPLNPLALKTALFF